MCIGVASMGIGVSAMPVGSNDRGSNGYRGKRWGNNGGNFVNGGNGEGNFTSSIFIKDSLECSLGLSNISGIIDVSRFDSSRAKGNMFTSCSSSKGSIECNLCGFDLFSVFDGDCGGNSQNGSENESLHDDDFRVNSPC